MVARSVTMLLGISMTIFPLPLIFFQLMAKESMLSTGKLPLGGLPRKSVVRITVRPDITSAAYRGRKTSIQTNKETSLLTSEPSVLVCGDPPYSLFIR